MNAAAASFEIWDGLYSFDELKRRVALCVEAVFFITEALFYVALAIDVPFTTTAIVGKPK